MKLLPLVLIFAGLFTGYTGPHAQAQPQVETVRVGILFVQFNDHATNVDARGSWGYIDTDNDNIPDQGIEHKYRYQDYWNLLFSDRVPLYDNSQNFHPDYESHHGLYETDPWTHLYPEAPPNHNAVPDFLTYNVHGSIRKYMDENSYGLLNFEPAEIRANESGIINHVTYQGTDPANGTIDWLTLPTSKEDYWAAHGSLLSTQVGWDAVDFARQQLPGFDWDEVDLIVVVYAGGGRGSSCYSVYHQSGFLKNYISGGALYECGWHHAWSSMATPGPLAHEVGHNMQSRARFSMELYSSFTHHIPNKYSGLGGNTNLHRQTPGHFDPIQKLSFGTEGWLRPIIVDDILYNGQLPIVEEPVDNPNDPRPFVYVLPIKGNFANGDWFDPLKEYYVIENRKATGFDSYLCLTGWAEPGTYGTGTQEGGFLLWHWNGASAHPKKLRLIEADGDSYLTRLGSYAKSEGRAGDLFTGSLSEPKEFSSWSLPGDFTDINSSGVPIMSPRVQYPRKGQGVYIRFPEWTEDGNIDVISVGKRFSKDDFALKNNNQRKLLFVDEKCYFVYEADGQVIATVSTDAGYTWSAAEHLSTYTWAEDGNGVYQRQSATKASAPSLCRGANDDVWAVWQEKSTTDKYEIIAQQIDVSTPQRVVVSPAEFDCGLTEGPTPVIGYGITPTSSTEARLKVIYQGTQGPIAMESTDAGANWTSVNTFWGKHHNLCFSSTRQLIVSQAPGAGAAAQDIIYQVDGAFTNNITVGRSVKGVTIQDNHSPSADINNDVLHISWVAEIEETDDQGQPLIHEKPAHAMLDLTQSTSAYSAVVNILNRKTGKTDPTAAPSIAAIPGGTGINAELIWNVDGGMRYNEFKLRARKPLWGNDKDSKYNDTTNYFPALAGGVYGSRYIVARGFEAPYKIHSSTFAQEVPGGLLDLPKDKVEVKVDIVNNNDRSDVFAGLNIHPAEKRDTSGAVVEYIEPNDLPMLGFDGTRNGPGLYDLFLSDTVNFRCDEYIVWNLDYFRSSTYWDTDTVIIRSYLIDAASGSTIITIGESRVYPQSMDTTISMGFELPPQYCPETQVQIAFEMGRGPEHDNDRFYLLTVNQESDVEGADGSPKRSVTQSNTQSTPDGYALSCYPNPVTNIAQFAYTIPEDLNVRIAVYDILGKEIKLLHDGSKAAGSHVASFNGSNLPNGLYFYRMTAGSRTLTGKFNLIRN